MFYYRYCGVWGGKSVEWGENPSLDHINMSFIPGV